MSGEFQIHFSAVGKPIFVCWCCNPRQYTTIEGPLTGNYSSFQSLKSLVSMQLLLWAFVTQFLIRKDSHRYLSLNQIGYLSFTSKNTDQSTKNPNLAFEFSFQAQKYIVSVKNFDRDSSVYCSKQSVKSHPGYQWGLKRIQAWDKHQDYNLVHHFDENHYF